MRFVADVRIRCKGCGIDFAFIGLPKRLSTELPGVGITRLEASLPIEPLSKEAIKEELSLGGSIQIDPN